MKEGDRGGEGAAETRTEKEGKIAVETTVVARGEEEDSLKNEERIVETSIKDALNQMNSSRS